MIFISNNLLKLEKLHLKTVSSKLLKNVLIPSIKSLNIKRTSSLTPTDWKAVVKSFPNLETLSIETMSDEKSVNDLMFNIITKGLQKLSHLKLGIGFIGLKRIFNQLLRNCPNLKLVEVPAVAMESQKSNKSAILRDFRRDGLCFIIHPTDEIYKIFISDDAKGLWYNEEAAEEFDETEDEDDDDDEDMGEVLAIMMALGGANPWGGSSDSDNDFIYFDSDGEMRHWDEDPSDYGYLDEDNYDYLD